MRVFDGTGYGSPVPSGIIRSTSRDDVTSMSTSRTSTVQFEFQVSSERDLAVLSHGERRVGFSYGFGEYPPEESGFGGMKTQATRSMTNCYRGGYMTGRDKKFLAVGLAAKPFRPKVWVGGMTIRASWLNEHAECFRDAVSETVTAWMESPNEGSRWDLGPLVGLPFIGDEDEAMSSDTPNSKKSDRANNVPTTSPVVFSARDDDGEGNLKIVLESTETSPIYGDFSKLPAGAKIVVPVKLWLFGSEYEVPSQCRIPTLNVDEIAMFRKKFGLSANSTGSK